MSDGDLNDLAKFYRECADRAEDLREAEDVVHGTYLEHQRRFLRRNPIGQMRRLGPSLIQPNHAEHVFEVSVDGFEAGTSVPYADNYVHAQDREIIDMSPDVQDAINDEIAQYIFEGELE